MAEVQVIRRVDAPSILLLRESATVGPDLSAHKVTRMAWTNWKLWSGNVINTRVRAPASGMAAYGPSHNPLTLEAGAIGTVVNILREGAAKPDYVRFKGSLNYSLAAEILFRKADNSESMWKHFFITQMKNDECVVVIPYPPLDKLEIEYEPR
ncbi:hypothetical protein [Paraburkholderia unamae]|uniref:hypothetical protein n=1 Tax=Paraburkholderia unamae TaxID=219649 RepID=UPI0011BFA1BD|nr:hypothetical protein [Paraburkholderia unamae]